MQGSDQDDLVARIGALEDVERIKQLKARYFRLLDTKDWAAWAEVFTDDAVLDVPDAGVTLTGRDTIVASVSRSLEGAITVHHGHLPEIEVDGDTATGVWAMFDLVEWSRDGAPAGIRGFGHYHDEYRRTDVGWRIARSRLVRLRRDAL
jgi:uncharacterized protein (TIGR02246 family)